MDMLKAKRRILPFIALSLSLVFLAFPSRVDAQIPIGVRAGVSVDPDQFYFGAHAESGPMIREVRFRPNVEAGIGDNRTVIALNGEFIRRFALDDGYAAYLGAGPAIVITSRDLPRDSSDTDTDVGPGFNFLVGLDFPEPFFVELKVGVIDSPRVKFGVGYTFP